MRILVSSTLEVSLEVILRNRLKQRGGCLERLFRRWRKSNGTNRIESNGEGLSREIKRPSRCATKLLAACKVNGYNARE